MMAVTQIDLSIVLSTGDTAWTGVAHDGKLRIQLMRREITASFACSPAQRLGVRPDDVRIRPAATEAAAHLAQAAAQVTPAAPETAPKGAKIIPELSCTTGYATTYPTW